MNTKSIYSNLYVQYSHRARRTPRLGRKWRPRVIAWSGPAPFMLNRFYELDSWYKARIHKPELLPKLHIIDPDLYSETLAQRLQASPRRAINIGFKKIEPAATNAAEHSARDEDALERMALKNQIRVSLEEAGIDHIPIANHFKIFDDLFMPGVYFHNTQEMTIRFPSSTAGDGSDVLFGNLISASSARQQTEVSIGGNGNGPSFNTLVMVNLDGDGYIKEGSPQESNPPPPLPQKTASPYQLNKNKAEMRKDEDADAESPGLRTQLAQWIVTNIPSGGSLGDGEVVVPYLQPLPFHGTGYHRIAFLLFKHRQPLDLSNYKLSPSPKGEGSGGDQLAQRRFSTAQFFKSLEEEVTPSAIRFCQMIWDESCDEKLKQMGLNSPRYWYEWNPPLKMEQKEFPMKSMPFNHYLDMFRTPESVRKHVRDLRLEMLVTRGGNSPFPEKPKYPDIFYTENRSRLPYWMHMELIKRNTGQGVYAALYSDYINPAHQHIQADGGGGGQKEGTGEEEAKGD